MRKVLSATLIVILFINLFGYFISFTAQRCKIRAEVRELLKQEKIKSARHFVFTAEEFAMLDIREGGKEFCLNGDMYDVIGKSYSRGKVILTAFYDHKETGLIDKFVSFFGEENSSSKDKQQVPEFSLLEFVSPDGEWKVHNPLRSLSMFNAKPEFISPLSVDLLSPPPDLHVC